LIYLYAHDMLNIIGKHLMKATIFQTSPQSKVCTKNYGPPKSRKSQFREFRDSQLGVLGQNDIWAQGPLPGTDNTIRGKVMASLNPRRGESCKSVFARGSSMHQKCSNYALTNLLFNLCKSMWIIDPLVTHPSLHPRALARPSTPKVLQTRDRTPTLYPSIIFTLDSQLSLSKNLGVRQY
jgi:hypothetical protein